MASTMTTWDRTPANAIATAKRSSDWCSRLIRYSSINTPVCEFGLKTPATTDFSLPIRSDATTTIRAYPKQGWPAHFGIPRGTVIPWNPAWRPSLGEDSYLAIEDPATGDVWALYAMSSPTYQGAGNYQYQGQVDLNNLYGGPWFPYGLPAGVPPYNPATCVCAAGAWHITKAGRLGNSPGVTGGGIEPTVGIVRPDEVASGNIGHAAKVALPNNMGGPLAAPSILSPDDPSVGVSVGLAASPAGNVERIGTQMIPAVLAQSIPECTRFALTLSDAAIDRWATGRGYTGKLKATAMTIARAWRDYGFFSGDSTPTWAPTSVTFDSADTSKWRALGIIDDGTHLLDGLVMSPADVRCLVPATSVRVDGSKSQREGQAVSISYP